jgi:hypothetical protein
VRRSVVVAVYGREETNRVVLLVRSGRVDGCEVVADEPAVDSLDGFFALP